jgi:hypothetical protein
MQNKTGMAKTKTAMAIMLGEFRETLNEFLGVTSRCRCFQSQLF